MNKWFSIIIISAMVISLPHASFAQEENVEYGYGTVVKVDKAKNEIVISEYDYDSDEEVDITYSVHPNVEFENVDLLTEINPGTYVDIRYVVGEGGKRIVKFIDVYKGEPEEIEVESEE